MKLTNKESALKLIEPSYLAAFSSLLWIALYYLPIGGSLFRLAIPMPLALLSIRRGFKSSFEGLIIQLLLLSIIMGPLRGPLVLFPYGLLSISLGWCWLNKKNWNFSIFIGVLIGFSGFIIRVLILSLLVGDNLWTIITRASLSLIEKFIAFVHLSYIPTISNVYLIAFGLILIQELFYVLTLHVIAYWVFPRLNSNLPDPPLYLKDIVELDR
tara:strand:+ start:53080 stop:53718 length:639 start_codon:yes stop_codon:yes gene_type:complete